MSRTINFVGDLRKKLTKVQVQDQKILRWTLVGLATVFALFLATVGVRFLFIYQLNNLQSQQTAAQAAILEQESVEREYNIFAHKLRHLSMLFGQRQDKQEALMFFSQVFGPDVIVSGIDYAAGAGDLLSFTILVPDVFELERVFAILEGDEVRSEYPTVQKQGLRRGDDARYRMSLQIQLESREEVEFGEAELGETP